MIGGETKALRLARNAMKRAGYDFIEGVFRAWADTVNPPKEDE